MAIEIFVTVQPDECLSDFVVDGVVTKGLDTDELSAEDAGTCKSIGAFISRSISLPATLTGDFSGITGEPIEDQSILSASDRADIGIGNMLLNGNLPYPFMLDATKKTDNSQSND